LAFADLPLDVFQPEIYIILPAEHIPKHPRIGKVDLQPEDHASPYGQAQKPLMPSLPFNPELGESVLGPRLHLELKSLWLLEGDGLFVGDGGWGLWLGVFRHYNVNREGYCWEIIGRRAGNRGGGVGRRVRGVG
jgi:hypothetical protein